jgi:protein-S-isoprenylcysteine O-methyltransferase Ste14
LHQTPALLVIAALWSAWLLLWLVAARHVKPTRWREPATSRLRHRLPLALAAWLLAVRAGQPPFLTQRFLPAGFAGGALGAAMVAAGLGFAVWARWHLGSNWSGNVTLKQDHALIRTGPYRYVRHPIYSGMLLALLGTAVAIGEWRGLVAVALAFVGLAYKSTVEEGRLREIFPEYDDYRRQTAALIPMIF